MIRARKVEMNQLFDEGGRVVPATILQCEVQGDLEGLETGLPVVVTGTSKAKGFAGVMKRWGFSGGPATHGQSDRARAPGSIGAGTTPGRVQKGKKMPGRMGGERITVKGLRIVGIDKERGTLQVSGAVPGRRGNRLVVRVVVDEKSQAPSTK